MVTDVLGNQAVEVRHLLSMYSGSTLAHDPRLLYIKLHSNGKSGLKSLLIQDNQSDM